MLSDDEIKLAVNELVKCRQAFTTACSYLAVHIDYDKRCPALFDNSAKKMPLPCNVDGNNKANHCKKKNEPRFTIQCWKMYFLNII